MDTYEKVRQGLLYAINNPPDDKDINKVIQRLKRAITAEKKRGYGGICYDLDDYEENVITAILDYVNKNHSNVKYYKTGYNDNGCYVGKIVSFDF
jgi:hypothetical protein